MLTRKVSILGSLMLLFNLNSFAAFPYNKSYESLDKLSNEVLILGDIVTIGANWCWSIKNPTEVKAKKRLEIYKSDKWQSVGRTIFTKSSLCQKETPYLQQFQWEVDQMGIMDNKGISGKLRVRNSAVKPTISSQVVIYKSESAYHSIKSVDAAFLKSVTGFQWTINKRASREWPLLASRVTYETLKQSGGPLGPACIAYVFETYHGARGFAINYSTSSSRASSYQTLDFIGAKKMVLLDRSDDLTCYTTLTDLFGSERW
jgi:hypothetical protein